MQIFDGPVARLYLAATYGRAQEPRAQETRAHARHGRVQNREQGSAAARGPLRLAQLKVTARDGVEHEVVVRLEEVYVRDVRGGCALRLARVSKARASRRDRSDTPAEPIAFERARAEVFEQERRARRGLPEPIVHGRERERRAVRCRGGVSRGRDARDGRVRVFIFFG